MFSRVKSGSRQELWSHGMWTKSCRPWTPRSCTLETCTQRKKQDKTLCKRAAKEPAARRSNAGQCRSPVRSVVKVTSIIFQWQLLVTPQSTLSPLKMCFHIERDTVDMREKLMQAPRGHLASISSERLDGAGMHAWEE